MALCKALALDQLCAEPVVGHVVGDAFQVRVVEQEAPVVLAEPFPERGAHGYEEVLDYRGVPSLVEAFRQCDCRYIVSLAGIDI